MQYLKHNWVTLYISFSVFSVFMIIWRLVNYGLYEISLMCKIDAVSVARLEAFRALKFSRFESFTGLNYFFAQLGVFQGPKILQIEEFKGPKISKICKIWPMNLMSLNILFIKNLRIWRMLGPLTPPIWLNDFNALNLSNLDTFRSLKASNLATGTIW